MIHGQGLFTYGDGDDHNFKDYKGAFLRGKFNGEGVLTGKDGTILFQGQWVDNQPVRVPVPAAGQGGAGEDIEGKEDRKEKDGDGEA